MSLRDFLFHEESGITLYCGAAEKVASLIQFTAVLSDPPWGADTATNAQRFTRSPSPWWNNVDTSRIVAHERVVGDKEPFDPAPWLKGSAILWGANHYASRLPDSGGWLIWDKRRGAEDMAEKGWPLGEAELAWSNVIGTTRVFRNLWSGLLRSAEKGEFYHPTQKPVALMEWCLGFLDENDTVLDPFCGSGTTLLAAKNLGRLAIGIEVESRYCEIAVKRLRQEVLPLT